MSERYKEMNSDFKYDALASQKHARRSMHRFLSVLVLLVLGSSPSIAQTDYFVSLGGDVKIDLSAARDTILSDSCGKKFVVQVEGNNIAISVVDLEDRVTYQVVFVDRCLRSRTTYHLKKGFTEIEEYKTKNIGTYTRIIINENQSIVFYQVFKRGKERFSFCFDSEPNYEDYLFRTLNE